MLKTAIRHVAFTLVGILGFVGSPSTASAQSYQIDCAILLCLSGGWPASAPCARARAEFIRRITPWPVEPPLQIWRCPMGASFPSDDRSQYHPRLFDALFEGEPNRNQSFALASLSINIAGAPPLQRGLEHGPAPDLIWPKLHLAQDQADIDISGPEFDFVRSIRVFDVRYARQHESGRDGDCNRGASVVLGTYGTQGDFSWRRSSTAALPSAHVGLERWGQNCPSIYHRSVFVDWRDYEGNYGFEQVDY